MVNARRILLWWPRAMKCLTSCCAIIDIFRSDMDRRVVQLYLIPTRSIIPICLGNDLVFEQNSIISKAIPINIRSSSQLETGNSDQNWKTSLLYKNNFIIINFVIYIFYRIFHGSWNYLCGLTNLSSSIFFIRPYTYGISVVKKTSVPPVLRILDSGPHYNTRNFTNTCHCYCTYANRVTLFEVLWCSRSDRAI